MKEKNNFLFSVSTCAFQIEGARNLCGRTDSLWDEHTKRNYYIPPIGSVEKEINSIEVAADFYHKYKTDIRIMKKLGLNAFVYNLDWTRIFPKDENYINPEGIKFYIDVFEELQKSGIKPIPILFHWDTPMWAVIDGHWESKKILSHFRKYVSTCFKYLGKYTDIWFVNDENSSFSLSGHLNGLQPPRKKSKEIFAKVLHNLNLSGAIAKEEFEKAKQLNYISKSAMIGIDHDWSPAVPFSKTIEDIEACKKFDKWNKNLFLDPNLKGKYPKCFLEWMEKNNIENFITKEDMNFLKNNTLDFIGWNYYRPTIITGKKHLNWNKLFKNDCLEYFENNVFPVLPIKDVKYTKWNWIIDPSMLSKGAKVLSDDYGKNIPIMIIENGYGDFDNKLGEMILDYDRINFLKMHLNETLIAKEMGINMIGYSLWTYCDIYSPSGGYRKDYGLISVDFNSPIKERTPKLSYIWYQKVIESKGKKLEFSNKELENSLENLLNKWDLFYR